MPDGLRIIASVALAAGIAALLVPVMIRVAHATGFLDRPLGYKGHSRPTPYLGGSAVVVAFAAAATAFGGGAGDLWVVVAGAVALWAVGTVDDRVGVGPGLRVAAEVAAAYALWDAGIGFDVFAGDAADVLLSVVWVVGIVNAFNLMDNMDGASGSVACASAAGVAALALVNDDAVLAGLAAAIAGACLGFLPFNLARPSRIFLGDGGSMPVGFVLAAAIMAVPWSPDARWMALAAAVPLVALPVLDTALVVFSRLRRRVQVLSGGRDHLTFRLRERLGSAQRVAVVLALGQAGLCALGIGVSEAAALPAAAITAAYLTAGVWAIHLLELPWRSAAAGGPAAAEERAA